MIASGLFFQTTNSVFNTTDESNKTSISTPGHWSSRGGAETIRRQQKLIFLRSENYIKLHVEEVRKRRKYLIKKR